MIHKLNSVAILSLAMMLSACASTQHSAQSHTLLTDVATADQLNASILWQANLDLPATDAVQSITPLGDRLVVIEKSNIIVVIDSATGHNLWQYKAADRFQKLSIPTRRGKELIVASDTTLSIFDINTGSLQQQFRLAHVASTSPVADESQVILGSPSGRVFAQFTRSGIPRWEYDMGSAIVTKPVVMPGSVVVVDQSGSVAMLNATSGHIVWRDSRPPWGPVVAQPVIANSITYVASTDQKLYAFDRISGHVIWQYLSNKPLTADPVAIGDRIYQRTDSEGLICFDGLTGNEIWKTETPGRIVLTRRGQLWFHDTDAIRFVDPATGIELKSLPLSASVSLTVSAIDGDELYLSSDDGRIMKLGLK